MIEHLHEVPLSRLRLKNFKAFREAAIDFAPITVIAGVNSSGKSSILQGLLLARNTLGTRNISQRETPLVYSEKPLKFVEFEELVFGYSSNGRDGDENKWHGISLGFDLNFALFSEERLQKYFDTAGETWFPMEIGIEASFGLQKAEHNVAIRAVKLHARPFYTHQADDELSLLFEPRENEWNITYQFQSTKIEIKRRVEFDHFIPDLEFWGRPNPMEGKKLSKINDVYNDIFRMALLEFRSMFTEELHYVGPLRIAPEPSITQQQIDGLDVGEAGEKTIQLLYERIQDGKMVNFVRIPQTLDQFNLDLLSPIELGLEDALYNALRLMGIEQHLRIQKHGVSYQASLSLHQEDHFVPITDVGFGISQVLPIVAVCLLSQPGDIVIFEQPEIHLHPRAQAGLADLLLCTALSGKQMIIETHSDHLINRLRRRLAEYSKESYSNRQTDLVRIVFVEPPKVKGEGAKVYNATVTENGNITNWPPGFLAESATEARAILRAQVSKNKGLQEE